MSTDAKSQTYPFVFLFIFDWVKDPAESVATHSGVIAGDILARILQSLDESDFFSLKGKYDDYAITDMPFYGIEVTGSSRQSKRSWHG